MLAGSSSLKVSPQNLGRGFWESCCLTSKRATAHEPGEADVKVPRGRSHSG